MNKAFASDSKIPTKEIEYIITKGDTLWSIAEKYKSENQDPRDYIYKIEKLNNMSSAAIFEGQTIKILVMEGE